MTNFSSGSYPMSVLVVYYIDSSIINVRKRVEGVFSVVLELKEVDERRIFLVFLPHNHASIWKISVGEVFHLIIFYL